MAYAFHSAPLDRKWNVPFKFQIFRTYGLGCACVTVSHATIEYYIDRRVNFISNPTLQSEDIYLIEENLFW